MIVLTKNRRYLKLFAHGMSVSTAILDNAKTFSNENNATIYLCNARKLGYKTKFWKVSVIGVKT